MVKSSLFYLFLAFIVGLSSCTDDTEVGSGLLSSEDLEIEETDDFDLTIGHIPPTPLIQNRLLTVDGNIVAGTFTTLHSLGSLDDPIFGKMTSSIFARPYRPTLPDFEGSTYDSVALALWVDSTGFYGNPNTPHNIEVFLLEESFDNADGIPTDSGFDFNPRTLGSLSLGRPNLLSPTPLRDIFGDSMSVDNLLIIPLRNSYGQEIFNDTENLIDDGLFRAQYGGYKIVSNALNALFRVDLLNDFSALIIYYTNAQGNPDNYIFPLGAGVDNSPILYEYDLEGSLLESVLADSTDQSNIYLQGHAGVTASLDISDVIKERGKFVNLATLEFFVNPENQDTLNFPPPESINLSTIDSTGALVPIVDLGVSINNATNPFIFGGERETLENGIMKYEMNVTNHVKAILDGAEDLTTLFLTVRSRSQNANRVVLYGPDHPEYPIRLKLTYTKS